MKILARLAMYMICLFPFVQAQATENFGRIDSVDNRNVFLIINDNIYTMNLNLKVYDVRGGAINRYGLRTGQRVVYQYENFPKGVKKVSSIWIKNDDFVYVSKDEE